MKSQQLEELLYQALETEQGGIQIYETAIRCAVNEDLRDVQCETCHGPGSLHVEADNDAQAKKTIQRSPPEDLCATQCHTSDHSDTFQLEAYLRDIVGPGHGGKRRKELGEGPTGRQLRAAGLEKAGKTLGAGCLK